MSGIKLDSGIIGNLRHELHTPLNAMIGYSEIVMEECTERGWSRLVPDVQRINRGAKDLVGIVKKALDQERLHAVTSQDDRRIINAQADFQLRTSMNAIIGYTEMTIEEAEEEGWEDIVPDLQNIRKAADIFLARIAQIHDLQLDPDQARTGTDENLDPCGDQASLRGTDTGRDSSGHILVVDDNPMNRDTLTHYLERQRYTVSMAENGQQAIEMIGRWCFDLVLLDLMMPVMDGYQVLQELKGHEAWRDIPVIMISALDELDSVVRCIEMVAEDYLPKPFNQVLLRARIHASLDKKRLRDQEVEYLKNVAKVTDAAVMVEAGQFDPDSLADVAVRTDGLGQLARVFQSMAREVHQREMRLKQQVQQLRIELDDVRQARQVAEITETEYFQKLQDKAIELRQIIDSA